MAERAAVSGKPVRMRFEVELRGGPGRVSGFIRMSCERGMRQAVLTDAPPSSVAAALHLVASQMGPLLTGDEQLLITLMAPDDDEDEDDEDDQPVS